MICNQDFVFCLLGSILYSRCVVIFSPYISPKRTEKEKEGIGKGRKKNNPTYQTPIAGETTTGLRVGWLLLISAADVSPPLS
jgi:hypothetical protein